MLERVKENAIYIIGEISIPKALIGSKGPLMVHISDTPLVSYDPIRRVLKKLDPDYLIHSGDVVDNIKLGLDATRIDLYKRHLKQFDKTLKCAPKAKKWIALGNHDDACALREAVEDVTIIPHEEGLVIEIEHKRVAISHYYRKIVHLEADFYFFGHHLEQRSQVIDNRFIINGIEQIFVYDFSSSQYYSLRYPIGTDDARLLRSRIGI